MALGRWPNLHELRAFPKNIANPNIRLPPLFRGLVGMDSTRAWLRHADAYGWHLERGSLDPAGTPDLGGNLFTAWTGPGVSFLHLEKCGGIAAIRWLSSKFHPEQINRDPWRDLPSSFYWRAPPTLADHTARYPLVWGHYDLPTLQRLAPGHVTFTLLREPRDRLFSLYRFWRSVDPSQFDPDLSFSVALAHRLSLPEFLACDDPFLLDLTDNLYTRRLTGLYATGAARDPLAENPDAAFNAAARALDRLGYVGITEQLTASLSALAHGLGIAPPAADLRANAASENHTDPSGWFRRGEMLEREPEIEAALKQRTKLDRALYARAVAAMARVLPDNSATRQKP